MLTMDFAAAKFCRVQPSEDPVGIPQLLGVASAVYEDSIRARLVGAGLSGISRSGVHVLEGMVYRHKPARWLTGELGITKQAESQLLDRLVRDGYLEREANPED